MTGIVVVSHSRPLAEAAVALATDMVHGDASGIAIAAGLSETELGTDANAIAEAIGHVMDNQGVVVLMDLGSAIMSSELALELLDDADAERVRLSWAPLVEGLVGAVVTAAGGADRETVAHEAEVASEAKRQQVEG